MEGYAVRLPLAILVAVILGNVAKAQTTAPTQGAIEFAMIGITQGQTLQLNLVAVLPSSCIAQLGFQNSSGDAVGPTSTVTLMPGQSASISLNGGTLVKGVGQRAEVLPVVTSESTYPSTGCIASAEVVDNVLGITTVSVPGSVEWPPSPGFGMLGATALQTVRLDVVAYPPNPCIGQLSFADANGNPIGKTMAVNLAPGQAAFLEFPPVPIHGLTARTELRPVVTLAPTGVSTTCVASVEVYANGLGVTQAYWPPGPIFPPDPVAVGASSTLNGNNSTGQD